MYSRQRHPARAMAREPLLEAAPGALHGASLFVQRALLKGGPLPVDERATRLLQSLAGNRALNTVLDASRAAATPQVQRSEAEPAPVAETPTLRAARFVDNERLQRAARNSPPLRLNESDDAVARMQRAFLDLGYKMPVTTKSGGPTGFYGPETAATVNQFQRENGVRPPGGHEAGKKTLTALDEACLKHDAAITVTPALVGGSLVSTRPAFETPDKKVSEPSASVIPGATTAAPEAKEGKHPAQIEISGGLEGDVHLSGKPRPGEPPDFFCDHVKFEVTIAGNIDVLTKEALTLGKRVTLLPNVGVSANLSPLKCGKAPGVEAHVDLLKLKLSEATEFGVMTSFQPHNTKFTGWIAGAGVSFDWQPSKKAPLFVGVEGKAAVERLPLGSGHFFWVVEGGFAVKYEFSLF